MFERTKSLLGMGGREKRYPDPEKDYDAPEDVEDPHTTPDNTRMTAGEFITSNSVSILTFLLLGIVLILIAIVYLGTYFATALANPWVQRLLAAMAILSLGYFYGRSSQRAALMNRDLLVIYDPDSQDVTRFLGEFRKAKDGDSTLFEPIKGYSKWGHSPEKYEIRELSEELYTRYDRDPTDGVVIKLHPNMAATAPTNTGRITVQLSAGLDPDPFGGEANVEATIPDTASKGTVRELKQALEAADSELEKLRRENNMLHRQRNDAIREAEKPRDEIRSEVSEVMEMVYPFASGMSGSIGNRTNGDRPDRDELDVARKELMPDD